MRKMKINPVALVMAGVLFAGSANMPVYAEEDTAAIAETDGSSGQDSTQTVLETGWKPNGGAWIYYGADGMPQKGGFTPDGYLVDGAGGWWHRSIKILDEIIQLPDRFVTSSQMGNWSSIKPDLDRVAKRIQTILGSARRIQISDEGIEYWNVSIEDLGLAGLLFNQTTQKTENLLFRLSRDGNTDGYQFEISANLGNRDNDISKVSTYDYAMFYLLLSKISHTPDTLADGIYGSWQGSNPYHLEENKEVQVGDAFLSYRVKQGAGVYLIRSAF